MKRILALVAVLLLAPCLTGCFTTAARMNNGMSGGSTEVSIVPAVVLDVVTSPIQAPFIVGMVASQPSLVSRGGGKSAVNSTQKQVPPPLPVEAPVGPGNIHAKILQDPEYLFTHRPLLTKEKVCILIADRKIPFTADQLRRLGATNEWTRTYVAGNWRCPPDLMEDIWNGLPTLPDAERPIAAANLVSNPNVPTAWLLEIMKRRDLYGDASAKAAGQYYLGGRRAPTPHPGSPSGSVSPSPGK